MTNLNSDPRKLIQPKHPIREQIENLLAVPFVWLERHRERQSLMQLDDQLLKDIGISRADVFYEADKPFWRQ